MQAQRNELANAVGKVLGKATTSEPNEIQEEEAEEEPGSREEPQGTATTMETSGNENLEMLGDVATLLQTPSKKSLPQRKTRGKRKKDGEESLTPLKRSKTSNRSEDHDDQNNDEDDADTLYKLAPLDDSLAENILQGPTSADTESTDSDAPYKLVPSVESTVKSIGLSDNPLSVDSDVLYRLAGSVGNSSVGPASTYHNLKVGSADSPGFLSSPEESVLFR
jgi:hypothetical protein